MSIDAIVKRFSVRSYDAPMGEIAEGALRQLITEDSGVYLVSKEDMEPYIKGLIFNYGRIKGESHYLVFAGGATRAEDLVLGHRVEELVLKAKALGIDSCIIGGMFKGDKLSTYLGLTKGESVKIIVSLGIKADQTFKRRRKPLLSMVYDKMYGKDASNLLFNNPDIKEVLELARIAPSAVNLAPWSFVVDDEYKRVLIIKEPRLYDKFAYVDLGIVACHIEMGFNELRNGGELHFVDDAKDLELKYGVDGKRRIVGYYRYNI